LYSCIALRIWILSDKFWITFPYWLLASAYTQQDYSKLQRSQTLLDSLMLIN